MSYSGPSFISLKKTKLVIILKFRLLYINLIFKNQSDRMKAWPHIEK